MFINKATNGKNNICGGNISRFRMELHISQRELADRLQLIGLDIDKNAIQRIEAGKRFITDIELVFFAHALEKDIAQLLEPDLVHINRNK
ncbi:MAG: helix-turn-helix transcriptional regulator [Firmicutes bacterium]|nr:helix-turn-helix transcriptional regulator [Bacillota bacterium]